MAAALFLVGAMAGKAKAGRHRAMRGGENRRGVSAQGVYGGILETRKHSAEAPNHVVILAVSIELRWGRLFE